MVLHELIASRQEQIIRRFTASFALQETKRPASRTQIVDAIPRLLTQVIRALRHLVEPPARVESDASAAREHADQRFGLGFDIATVVDDYLMTYECIMEIAVEAGVVISQAERRCLADLLFVDIQDATAAFNDRVSLAAAANAEPPPSPPLPSPSH